MEELSKFFPANIKYEIPYDITPVVEASIKKVIVTLIEAVILVFLVMLLFLQNIRYTLIPTVVVPVALLGTCATLLLMGLSINMLTLFAMVLAIGILVDDAIVVVENVERIMSEEGLPPREATRKAMTADHRRHHRYHAGAGGRVHPDGIFSGLGRRDLSAVFRHHGVGHRLLRVPRAVADAGAVRDPAQAGRGRSSPREKGIVRPVQPGDGENEGGLQRGRPLDAACAPAG